MKKSVISLMLILVSLLITSCSGPVAGGEKPLDTLAAAKIVQSGTQGIELKFMQGFPPPYIYDQNELTALIEVQNKGAHNILPNECFTNFRFSDFFISASIRVASLRERLSSLEEPQ